MRKQPSSKATTATQSDELTAYQKVNTLCKDLITKAGLEDEKAEQGRRGGTARTASSMP